MICNKCNEEIPDSSKFCPNCGNRITNEMEEKVNREENTTSIHSTENNSDKNIHRKKLLIRIFIIIILLIGSIGGYKCFKNYHLSKIKAEGVTFLKEKNYNNALNKFNEILIKDNKNKDVIALRNLTKDCIALTNNYNNNDFPSVIKGYNKIKTDPNFNIVNSDINQIYNDSKKKPNLNLKYVVYGSEEFSNNKYYENGNGEIVLGSSKKSELDNNAFIIDNIRPFSEVNFEIENTGINPAEDLVLNLKFNNMAIEFEPDNPKWQGVSSVHGMGLWNEIKFVPKGELLYKDTPIKFTLIFANAAVDHDANIEVTLLSKDSTTKKFNIPVKVKQY